MKIRIECERTTERGATFDQIAVALSNGVIREGDAHELITELESAPEGGTVQHLVYLISGYGVSQSGPSWVLINTDREDA